MDFLDPKKRQNKRRRLILGYFLITFAITIVTMIMVFAASGNGVDTKTGELVEKGLLFVNSNPNGASIYINGEFKGKTNERYNIPSGTYTVKLTKDGYRDWERNFVLEPHSVQQLVYPFLLPKTLLPKTVDVYQVTPNLITESLDRKWLLINRRQADQAALTFDQFEVTKTDDGKQTFTIPSNSLINNLPTLATKEVEWSTDNRHLLIERHYSGGIEYVLVDRDQPALSKSINRLFSINPVKIAMRDNKANQFYVLDKEGVLRIADVKSSSLSAPILLSVLDFKGHGDSLLSYVTYSGAKEGKAQYRIYDNGDTYLLYEMIKGASYQLDIARFDGNWYYVIGSEGDKRVTIFKNPLDKLKKDKDGQAKPFLALTMSGSKKVKFSANTRFISSISGQDVAVYDIEQDKTFSYQLKEPVTGDLRWMDGHRLIGITGANMLMLDFDNSNHQIVTTSNLPAGGYFDRDYESLIVLVPIGSSGAVSLKSISLLAGVDAPKTF